MADPARAPRVHAHAAASEPPPTHRARKKWIRDLERSQRRTAQWPDPPKPRELPSWLTPEERSRIMETVRPAPPRPAPRLFIAPAASAAVATPAPATSAPPGEAQPKKKRGRKRADAPPTRIYSYGCLPPVEGIEQVDKIIRTSVRYYNTLAKIERGRRQNYTAAIASMLPPEVLEAVEYLEAFEDASVEALKAAKAGRKRPDLEGEKEMLAAVRGELKAARKRARELSSPVIATVRQFLVPQPPPELREVVEGLEALEAACRADARAGGKDRDKEELLATVQADLRLATQWAGVIADEDIPRESQAMIFAIRAGNEAAHAAWIAARADKENCPPTGTYLEVEKSIRAAMAAKAPKNKFGRPTPWDQLPRDKRSDGSGRVAVHLNHGRTPAEIYSCTDTHLQIGPRVGYVSRTEGTRKRDGLASLSVLGDRDTRPRADRLAYPPFGWGLWATPRQLRRKEGVALVPRTQSERIALWRAQPEAYRLGSRGRHQFRRASRQEVRIRGESEGRKPTWIRLPFVFHRLLPADGLIKDAWMLRVRKGLTFRYHLQIVVEAESFRPPPKPIGNGTVAVNFGWRTLDDGRIRAAYWRNSDGEEGQLLLPAKVEIGLKKVQDLQAIRAKNFDFAKALLMQWLATLSPTPENEWLREHARFIAQWRAQRRLAWILGHPEESFPVIHGCCRRCRRRSEAATCVHPATGWEARRFDGDDTIVRGLRAWVTQDRHLLEWEVNQRSRRIGHRRAVWREWAVRLARRYGRILMCEMDLRDLTRQPAPEEGDPADDRRQRYVERIAAPGELRTYQRHAALKYGSALVEISSVEEKPTKTCWSCRAVDEWDSTSALVRRCQRCGTVSDQDANHVRILLEADSASGPTPPGSAEPLAPDNVLKLFDTDRKAGPGSTETRAEP